MKELSKLIYGAVGIEIGCSKKKKKFYGRFDFFDEKPKKHLFFKERRSGRHQKRTVSG